MKRYYLNGKEITHNQAAEIDRENEMQNYQINFIDGHDLRFKTFQTEAETEDEAIHHLYVTYGDFDHAIVAVIEK